MSSAFALFPDVLMTETMNPCRKGKSAINITWVGICHHLPLPFNYGLNKSNGEIGLRKRNVWQHIWDRPRMQYVSSNNFILFSIVNNLT
jgi:hypothetical protein